MDNLTHALVGLLCAEAAVRTRERRTALHSWTRVATYAFAIIGNNAPDLDFSYAWISGKTFGYLLQHRGYTHTVPAAFGFALLMLGVLLACTRARKVTLPRADWWSLAGVALLSPLLHLAMDFANNYGVHPFWPVYDGWFYGDSLFILEPSLWLVLLAPLSLSYRSRVVRGGAWLVLGLSLGALWYRDFVPRGHAVLLTLLTAALLALALGQSKARRLLLAGAGFVLVLSLFVFGSRRAKRIAVEGAAQAFRSARTLDVVVTPMPANPFCWSTLLVQEEGGDYVVRIGRVATWPAWLDVSRCSFDRASTPTAPLRSLRTGNDPRLVLNAEYRVAREALRALDRTRCDARAFFRFGRVPYLGARETDGARILGDLRYDRNPGLDFSDVRLTHADASAANCPRFVPPWRPPRTDLLSPGDEERSLSIPATHD